MSPAPLAVIQFWRDEVGRARWFDDDAALDAAIKGRFEPLWQRARDGALARWEGTVEGALALVIVLDQFPRNMFRGQADAFATDPQALAAARRAIAAGYDRRVPDLLRPFFYMPFMHAEDLAAQDECIALFTERLGPDTYNLPYARAHRDVIARFGRFPARNAALGRASTLAETTYLESLTRR
jgi:uncharacterized protein (DUF924 family)